MSKFLRKVKVGDKIKCKGLTVKVCKILSQDFYKDEYYKDYGTEDRSYIDLEFTDERDNYRSWKSHLDGGSVLYSEEGIETKGFPSVVPEWYGKVYKLLKTNGYNCKNGICYLINSDGVWSVYYERENTEIVETIGYVEEEDYEFNNFIQSIVDYKGSDIYAIVCPTAVFKDEKYKAKLIVCREKEDFVLLKQIG